MARSGALSRARRRRQNWSTFVGAADFLNQPGIFFFGMLALGNIAHQPVNMRRSPIFISATASSIGTRCVLAQADHLAADADDLSFAGLQVPCQVPSCIAWYGAGISIDTFLPATCASLYRRCARLPD